MTTAAITTIPDFLRGTSKKKKLSWILSLVLSVAYFGVFVTEAILSTTTTPHNHDNTMGLLLGFCVWGRPLQPDQTGGCHGSPENSHVLAFGVDLVYAGVVWYLYSYYRTTRLQEPQQEEATNKELPTRKFVVVGAILLGHGVLHGALYLWMDCHFATTPENLPWFVTLIGYSLYATFTFGLCFFILAMGFLLKATTATTTGEDDEKNSPKGSPFDLTLEWTRRTTIMRIVCPSLVVTALVVILSLVTGSQWVLPSLFAVSHPLSSITGIWSPSPIFSSRMGWFFLVATVVGILELSTCQVFFRKVGGHVWYDIALHAAVLMGLPPFAPSTTVRRSLEADQN